MAAAGGEGLARTPLLPASAVLALLSILVYLGALCAACRRKGRKKKVPLDGVKLVDESLLRRAQLRSLSKSDTKLHELYRVKPSGDAQRPASLDIPGAGSSALLQHRQLPRPPEPPEQTYSNLPLPAPRPPGRGEDAPLPLDAPGRPPPRLGGPDYACVRKVKQTVLVEEQDDARRAQLEEMYSTVCKATRKKVQVPTSSPGEVGAAWPQPRPVEGATAGFWSPAAQAPPDPCYESINDRAWTAQRHSPDPDYEIVDTNWKKAAKRDKQGKPCIPENLYESVGDIWAGEPRQGPARTAASGLEVYISNL